MIDINTCPKCGGIADNGHDRCLPPSPYYCTKCTEIENMTDKIRDEQRAIDDGKRALEFLAMQGYRKCDIAACNCPYWHGGNAEARLSELHEIMNDAGLEPHRKTIRKAVQDLITTSEKAKALVAELVKALNMAKVSMQETSHRFNHLSTMCEEHNVSPNLVSIFNENRKDCIKWADKMDEALTKAQKWMEE